MKIICSRFRASISIALSVAFTLLLTMGPVWAGSYQVTYSGGTVTAIQNDGTSQVSDYNYSTYNGLYGSYNYGMWGTKTLPNGTVVATSGSSRCEGTITATFTWQSGYYGGDDEPPTDVVIAEQCATEWGSSGDGLTSGGTSNGLDFPEVSSSWPPSNIYSTSSGTRYKTLHNPGARFSITCAPQAHVTGTGVVGPPASDGSGPAEVQYQASAQPLQVMLSGGIGLQKAKSYLIGQGVGANVETGGLQATSYAWDVAGGKPFKSYTADASNGVFTALSNETNSTCSFHFAEPIPKATVLCELHLQVPTGALPAAGFDITLERDCLVDKPWNSLKVYIGSPQGDPPDTPTHIRL